MNKFGDDFIGVSEDWLAIINQCFLNVCEVWIYEMTFETLRYIIIIYVCYSNEHSNKHVT